MLQSLHFTGLAPLYMNVLTLYMNVLTTLLLPHSFDVLLEKKCYLAKTSLMHRQNGSIQLTQQGILPRSTTASIVEVSDLEVAIVCSHVESAIHFL